MPSNHQLGRRAMWACATLAAVATALMIASVLRPGITVRNSGASLHGGTLELMHASQAMTWDAPYWQVRVPNTIAAFILGSSSVWRPNHESASMRPGGTTLVTIDAWFIPLWPWALAAWAATGVLASKFPRRRPANQCPNCGYDLRGLPTSRCPECGFFPANPDTARS